LFRNGSNPRFTVGSRKQITQRVNPSGAGEVDGIDFVVNLVDPPR